MRAYLSMLTCLILSVGLLLSDVGNVRAQPRWNAVEINNAPKLYRKVLAGTVGIMIDGRVDGTGWIVDAKRNWIITNHHVVAGFGKVVRGPVTIVFPEYADGKLINELGYYESNQKKLARTGKVLFMDLARDLALIEVDSLPQGTQALPLAAESVGIAEKVFVVGNANAYSALWVYREGRVHVVARTLEWTDRIYTVASDVNLNPGDSGGPLVNEHGELVGINFRVKGEFAKISYSVDVREVRTFLRDVEGTTNPNKAGDFLKRAKRHKENKKYNDALVDLNEAIQRDAKLVEAYEQRSWVYNEIGKFPEAIRDASSAIELNERSTFAYLERVYAYEQDKDWENASADLEKLIDLEPKNAYHWSRLGKNRLASADHNAAVVALTTALKMGDRTWFNFEWRGDCYAALENFSRARDDYDAALILTTVGSNDESRIIRKIDDMTARLNK